MIEYVGCISDFPSMPEVLSLSCVFSARRCTARSRQDVLGRPCSPASFEIASLQPAVPVHLDACMHACVQCISAHAQYIDIHMVHIQYRYRFLYFCLCLLISLQLHAFLSAVRSALSECLQACLPDFLPLCLSACLSACLASAYLPAHPSYSFPGTTSP